MPQNVLLHRGGTGNQTKVPLLSLICSSPASSEVSCCPCELCDCIFKMSSGFTELDGTFWYSQVHTAWVIRPFLVTESCNVQPLRPLVLGKRPPPPPAPGHRLGRCAEEEEKKGDKNRKLTLMQTEMASAALILNWRNWPSWERWHKPLRRLSGGFWAGCSRPWRPGKYFMSNLISGTGVRAALRMLAPI